MQGKPQEDKARCPPHPACPLGRDTSSTDFPLLITLHITIIQRQTWFRNQAERKPASQGPQAASPSRAEHSRGRPIRVSGGPGRGWTSPYSTPHTLVSQLWGGLEPSQLQIILSLDPWELGDWGISTGLAMRQQGLARAGLARKGPPVSQPGREGSVAALPQRPQQVMCRHLCPASCSDSDFSPGLWPQQVLGMTHGRGCHPGPVRSVGLRGRGSKGAEPWQVARPGVAWPWH